MSRSAVIGRLKTEKLVVCLKNKANHRLLVVSGLQGGLAVFLTNGFLPQRQGGAEGFCCGGIIKCETVLVDLF